MEFFCYHRDRPGSTPLRSQMVEQHLSYMDQFAATMVARGPTFISDGTLTGSVHILDLPDPTAARTFAFEEPGYQAGAYRDVLLRRWRNSLGRTMWDFSGGRPDNNRYLVLGFTLVPAADAAELPLRDELIASGPLLSDDGSLVLGA
ncbi:MAG: YciI family protein, partial [Actinomycetota bacterium]|nr:YciI family protein [Actinomycetota bacterium]